VTRWPANLSAAAVALAREGVGPAASARVLNGRFGCAHTSDSVACHLRRVREANGAAAETDERVARALASVGAVAAPPQQAAPTVTVQRPTPASISAPVSTTPGAQAERGGGQLACVLSDLHIGQEDTAALACAEAWIAANRPATVILAGDVGEWESCSQHGTSPEAPTFRADVEAVRGWLVRLRRLVPEARLVMLEGNHETRLTRMLTSQSPALHGSLTVPDALGLAALGVEWVPEDKQPIALGSCDIAHGHQMLRGGFGPKYASGKAVDVYGSPGRSVLIGHTHRRQMYRRPMAQGYAEGVLLPCLRTLQAGWLHGEVNGWSHGFAVLTLEPGRRTAVEVVDIDRGRCWRGGRSYAG
jgi:hypothetical protein